jgi:uncharacterized protein (AIM24 family)
MLRRAQHGLQGGGGRGAASCRHLQGTGRPARHPQPKGKAMRDELLGATTSQVLSISLQAGESVVAVPTRFAWMTDSIEMAPAAPRLYRYTAAGAAGAVAFGSRRPGRILGVDLGGGGYLLHESGFVAGAPGVRVEPEADRGLPLCRVTGTGRAWVETAGDVVMLELAAGQALRVRPRHIGMLDTGAAVQLAEVPDVAGFECAVVSGPGTVWLQC